MGTHPIFESDFDCLTAKMFIILTLLLTQIIASDISCRFQVIAARFGNGCGNKDISNDQSSMKAKLQNLRSLASNGLKDKLQYEEGLRNYLKGQIEKSKEPVFQNVKRK